MFKSPIKALVIAGKPLESTFGAKLILPGVEVFLSILIVAFPWLVLTTSILPSPSRSAEFKPAGCEVPEPTAILDRALNELGENCALVRKLTRKK